MAHEIRRFMTETSPPAHPFRRRPRSASWRPSALGFGRAPSLRSHPRPPAPARFRRLPARARLLRSDRGLTPTPSARALPNLDELVRKRASEQCSRLRRTTGREQGWHAENWRGDIAAFRARPRRSRTLSVRQLDDGTFEVDCQSDERLARLLSRRPGTREDAVRGSWTPDVPADIAIGCSVVSVGRGRPRPSSRRRVGNTRAAPGAPRKAGCVRTPVKYILRSLSAANSPGRLRTGTPLSESDVSCCAGALREHILVCQCFYTRAMSWRKLHLSLAECGSAFSLSVCDGMLEAELRAAVAALGGGALAGSARRGDRPLVVPHARRPATARRAALARAARRHAAAAARAARLPALARRATARARAARASRRRRRRAPRSASPSTTSPSAPAPRPPAATASLLSPSPRP